MADPYEDLLYHIKRVLIPLEVEREHVLKRTITYEDFNGDTVSEDFYFHLSKAELVELEMSHQGGLQEAMRRIIAAEDGKAIIAEFKNIILSSYGVKSMDGKRFIKTQAQREEFESTEAYSTLFMELVTDAEAAAEFVRGIVPKDMAEEVEKLAAATPLAPAPPASTPEVVTRKEMNEMGVEELELMNQRLASGEVVLLP